MSLQDCLRESLKETDANLANARNRLELLEKEKYAEEERARVLDVESQQARSGETGIRNLVALAKQHERGIREQIRLLEEQLRKITGELLGHEQKLQELNSTASRLSKEGREHLVRATAKESSIEKQRAEIETLEKRRQENKRAALENYLSTTWKKISGLSVSAERRRSYLSAYRQFEEKRHSDPKLMEQYETRETWLKILGTNPVENVRTVAREKIAEIEKQFERQFPGIVSVLGGEVRDTAVSEIEDLYYKKLPEEAGTMIYLPLPEDAWQCMQDGSCKDSEWIVRFVWGLVNELGLDTASASFENDRGITMLRTGWPELSSLIEQLTVKLSPDASVEFIFTRLPEELKEVI